MGKLRNSFVANFLAVTSLTAAGKDLAEWTSAGWYVQNDDVMGGRSNSNLKLSGSGAEFEGSINMNGGGFASFRRNFGPWGERDLAQYSGLWVETDVVTEQPLFHAPFAVHIQLGDPSRYDHGAAFAIPSGPAGSTYSVFLPFGWFTKQLRWSCRGCTLDTGRINDLSVYALYQEGPFKFKIRQIRAVRDSEVPAFGQVPALVLSDAKAWMLVKATVERGSTLWNKGNPELCGAMYSMTAKTLTTASNISSSVQEISRVAMASAERYPVNLGGDAAWIYRKAFDHILAAYEGVSFPSDDRYPAVAHGDWAATAMGSDQVPQLSTTSLDRDMEQQLALNSAGQKSLKGLGFIFVMLVVGNAQSCWS
ncbi:CIA30 domain-containing protein [Durusdinium trenchii]|uniref:CIA30 domain-containing protein n=1 Tax=Durusdinium trenchii TaxID=1381693 RepID=A0ABP0R3V7_9DINO